VKKLIYPVLVLALLVPTVTLADAPHDLVVEESHVCFPDGMTNIKAYVTPYPTVSGSFDCCDRYYVRIFVDGEAKVWDEYHTNWWRWDNLEVSWAGALSRGEHTIKAEWGRYNIYATNPFGNVRDSQEFVVNIQPCVENKKRSPVFQMWLLTKEDSACILISEVHPSVERQKALCFPGQDWVAENALCNGWVYDDGFWECDMYGYGRLTFTNLFKIYKRHAAMMEELSR
jgi:hypothetical protein